MQTSPCHRIGVLADDLTSAADGAAPFVGRGASAWIGRNCLPRQACTLLSVDSGSRSLSELQAAETAARLTGQLASCSILYKTVDSTLRGHVRAELEASFNASGRNCLVFAPAFPAAGRTTVGGVQLANGVPVAETAYGRDPLHPARHSTLAELVPDSIARVSLLDASTQDELDAQVASIPEPETVLWAGSPGMANALARTLLPIGRPIAELASAKGEIVVAVGSANPLSHRQADQLANVSGVTLLRSPEAREEDPASLLERISRTAAQTLSSPRFGALIATGGDTMEAILDRLGIHGFEVLGELEAGFALGRARLRCGRALLVAMKAGGFGDEDALLRAVLHLRSSRLHEENPS